MSVRHALMGLLAQEGPLHGYELKAAFEGDLLPTSSLNFGQVYGSLERLERDGLVAHVVVSQQERPDKKVFRLTDAGRRELEGWLAAPSAVPLDLRNETLLKLAIAARLEGARPAEVIAVERRAAFARLREVTEARVRARADHEPVQLVLVLELAALRLEAFIRWLETCEEAFEIELGGAPWK
jgi:DNA-binding PadR family transcriptional regulator